ncbi:hypothetical protein FB107DRAFT_291528 [Schizophyllum commune]
MYDLLKYILMGQQLPDTVEAYQDRLALDPLAFMWVFNDIPPLVEAYAQVKADSSGCRDDVYPAILDVAARTLDYAQGAAGIMGFSIYSTIFQCARDVADATNPGDILALTRELDELIGEQLNQIDSLRIHSDMCTAALDQLDARMRRSQIAVQQRSEAMHNLAMLSSLRTTIAEMTQEYEREQLIACKAPSYRWLDLSGVLTSSAVAELRGNDAVSLAQLMDSVAATLASDAIINNDGNSIVADLKAVDSDLNSVLGGTSAAINVVEQMTGNWTAISSDLSNLRDMVKNDIEGANQYIANLNEKKIISDWKNLADAVARFRVAAQPEACTRSGTTTSTTMTELARQLRAQAGQ